MLKLRTETSFKKGYKRAIKRGYDMTKIEDVIDLLIAGKSLPSKYKDHNLVGNWKGTRECHIEPDWLLVYIKTDSELILVDTGTHSDLFG